jgi:ELWxxDGT repeat protein
MVKDIWPGPNFSLPNNMINVNGTLYFTAENSTYGIELWKSDGSEVGTVMVKDINLGGNTTILNATAVGNILYFRTDDGTHSQELWKTDGTEAGTLLVKDINPAGSSNPSSLKAWGNQLIFVATTPSGSRIHITPAPIP